jgi:hypothetical protein
MLKDICSWLDSFFVTNLFSEQYSDVGVKMEDMFDEKIRKFDELRRFDIQYELILPGRLLSTNADLQNEGNPVWNINMLKFLTDDYVLKAESRTVNVWAFAVTLLLIVFAAYYFRKFFRISR